MVMNEEAVRHFCDALVHPEAPKGLESIALGSKFSPHINNCARWPPPWLFSAHSEVPKSGIYLGDALIHPHGPMHLTELSLPGSIHGDSALGRMC